MVEIKIPEFGESIQEAQISQWLVAKGTWVQRDQPLVELETEKASQEVLAPEAGTLSEILVAAGEFVQVGTVIARLSAGAAPSSGASGAATSTVATSTVAAAGSTATLAPPSTATAPVVTAAYGGR